MTNAETPELKPCPFCGAKAELFRHLPNRWCVRKKCNCSTGHTFSDPKYIYEWWNTRHASPAIKGAIEALEAALQYVAMGSHIHDVIAAALAAVKKEEVQDAK